MQGGKRRIRGKGRGKGESQKVKDEMPSAKAKGKIILLDSAYDVQALEPTV